MALEDCDETLKLISQIEGLEDVNSVAMSTICDISVRWSFVFVLTLGRMKNKLRVCTQRLKRSLVIRCAYLLITLRCLSFGVWKPPLQRIGTELPL